MNDSEYCRAKIEIPFHFEYTIVSKINQNDVGTAPQGHRFSPLYTLKMVSLILFDEIPQVFTVHKLEEKDCNGNSIQFSLLVFMCDGIYTVNYT